MRVNMVFILALAVMITPQVHGLGDLWTSLLTSEKAPSCPGECLHAIASIFCDHVLEEVSCGQQYLRCCVPSDFSYGTPVETSPPMIGHDLVTENPGNLLVSSTSNSSIQTLGNPEVSPSTTTIAPVKTTLPTISTSTSTRYPNQNRPLRPLFINPIDAPPSPDPPVRTKHVSYDNRPVTYHYSRPVSRPLYTPSLPNHTASPFTSTPSPVSSSTSVYIHPRPGMYHKNGTLKDPIPNRILSNSNLSTPSPSPSSPTDLPNLPSTSAPFPAITVPVDPITGRPEIHPECPGVCVLQEFARFCGNIMSNGICNSTREACCLQGEISHHDSENLTKPLINSVMKRPHIIPASAVSFPDDRTNETKPQFQAIPSPSSNEEAPFRDSGSNSINSGDGSLVITTTPSPVIDLEVSPSNQSSSMQTFGDDCTGTCVAPLFALLCDEVDSNQYCPNSGSCCVNRDVTTTPSPTPTCEGNCIPIFFSGAFCVKPSRLIPKTSDCMSGTICCSQYQDMISTNGADEKDPDPMKNEDRDQDQNLSTDAKNPISSLLGSNSGQSSSFHHEIPSSMSMEDGEDLMLTAYSPHPPPHIIRPVPTPLRPPTLMPVSHASGSSTQKPSSYRFPSLSLPSFLGGGRKPVTPKPTPISPPVRMDGPPPCPGTCVSSLLRFTCFGSNVLYHHFGCSSHEETCCSPLSEVHAFETALMHSFNAMNSPGQIPIGMNPNVPNMYPVQGPQQYGPNVQQRPVMIGPLPNPTPNQNGLNPNLNVNQNGYHPNPEVSPQNQMIPHQYNGNIPHHNPNHNMPHHNYPNNIPHLNQKVPPQPQMSFGPQNNPSNRLPSQQNIPSPIVPHNISQNVSPNYNNINKNPQNHPQNIPSKHPNNNPNSNFPQSHPHPQNNHPKMPQNPPQHPPQNIPKSPSPQRNPSFSIVNPSTNKKPYSDEATSSKFQPSISTGSTFSKQHNTPSSSHSSFPPPDTFEKHGLIEAMIPMRGNAIDPKQQAEPSNLVAHHISPPASQNEGMKKDIPSLIIGKGPVGNVPQQPLQMNPVRFPSSTSSSSSSSSIIPSETLLQPIHLQPQLLSEKANPMSWDRHSSALLPVHVPINPGNVTKLIPLIPISDGSSTVIPVTATLPTTPAPATYVPSPNTPTIESFHTTMGYSPRPNPHTCGIKGTTVPRKTGRIVGGSESQPGEWCWQIALITADNQYICGGALIGTQWVVTAAHCITNMVRNGEDIFIRVGDHDLASESMATSPDAVSVQVSTTYIHHNHNGQTLDNDIALLKMEHPVQLTDSVCLVCLPTRGSNRKAGNKCTVTGFGYMSEAGPISLKVRSAPVPIVDDPDCTQKINSVTEKTFILPASSFCAGGSDGKDACQGDGGGPLVCESDGFYEVTGLVSWGFGCGRPDVPAVYVKVSSFIGWINQIISVNNQ